MIKEELLEKNGSYLSINECKRKTQF